MIMRGKAELPEASLSFTSVKPKLTVGGTLQKRTLLAPFGYEEIKIVYGEEEDQSTGRLIIPKFSEGARGEEEGPLNSRKNPERDDGQGGSRRSEEPMQHDPDQAEKEDDKASTGGISSLDFNFLGDFESWKRRLMRWKRRLSHQTRVLEPPSAFMEMSRNLPESGSPSNSKDNEQRLLMESPWRRRIEGAARVHFLRALPEEEWELQHRDHENRTGCKWIEWPSWKRSGQ